MFFFFFKQKTAYEMRISDWSSDVCSSDLFPVDDAVDEIDRVLVGRKRHQDTAIARGVAARADEFGLEADRRAIGDDLKIMIGEARQQRAARHLGDAGERGIETAFIEQRAAEERDTGDLEPRGENKQEAIGPENRKIGGKG